jgi:hypothetical protein|tara:strand:- start:423 stop:647 length:225 start_codon:yes stop_codon:yes gene_type:complete
MNKNEPPKYDDYALDNLLETVKFLYTALHYIKEMDEPMWQRANHFASDFQPELNIVFDNQEDDEDVKEESYGEN